MAKESTKVRRIKATEAEIVKPATVKKKNVKKQAKPDAKGKLNIKIKKPQAPQWLKVIGKPFVFLFGPFGRYVKGSFSELKQTKWPNRKSTWILTLAVIVFAVVFAGIILAIDQLFDLIVKNVIL